MTNEELIEIMETYPDKLATAKLVWGKAIKNREMTEGVRHMEIKAKMEVDGKKCTTDDLRAMVKADMSCFDASMAEIAAESEYIRINETLLSTKKIAGLRTAF